MLKETKETKNFCHICIIDDIAIGKGKPGPPAPLSGYAYGTIERILGEL